MRGGMRRPGQATIEALLVMFKDVPMPIESTGTCNGPACKVTGTLGDGYCQRHWDMGWPKRKNSWGGARSGSGNPLGWSDYNQHRFKKKQ